MADSSNTSPCKVTYNGAMRRFLLTRPASWTEFEYKIRSCYSLSPEADLSIQYRDDEDDIITLSTQSELQDVLDMHAIFHQSAPVKFEIFVHHPLPSSRRSDATPTAPSVANSVMNQSQPPSVPASSITSPVQPLPQHSLTAWGLAQLNQEHDRESIHSSVQGSSTHGQETPLVPFYAQVTGAPYHRRYGSEQSDDVSLIELEDGIEPPSRSEIEATSTSASSPRVELHRQPLSFQMAAAALRDHQDETLQYPVMDIETAMSNMQQSDQQQSDQQQSDQQQSDQQPSDQQPSEQEQLDQQELEQMLQHISVSAISTNSSSSSTMSQHTAIEQHEVPERDRAVEETLATEPEAPHLETTREETPAESSKDVKGKARAMNYDDTHVDEQPNLDADPSEPELPSTSTASTSTNERDYGDDDRALFEQFQLLVREFQHVIQNNPQLVALASTILDKIVNQVKVNVESFATYLQHQAHHAATTAQQAASEAAREAKEAAREAHEAARESIRENARNHPFFGQSPSCPFSDNKDFPFFPHQRFMFHRNSRTGSQSSPPPPQPAAPAAPAPPGPPVPPMPAMPAMPPMPPMPPMPGFFSSCSSTSGASSFSQPSKPSPFVAGFPFVTPAPKCGKAPKLRGRPKAQDTQANSGEGSSSSSSDMPGSFPGGPPMTEVNGKSGWTWMRLPEEDPKDQHLPPSTRAKYGWVWRDIGEKTEVQDSETTAAAQQGGDDSLPQYTPSTPNDPPATFPFGGRGGEFGSGEGRTSFFSGWRHTVSGSPHQIRSHSFEEQEQAATRAAQDARDASLRRRQTMLEGRYAAMKARQEAEEERKRHHQARVEQLVKKNRPHSHFGSFLFRSSSMSKDSSPASTSEAPVMGGGSLASIWPSLASTNAANGDGSSSASTRTPGEFPQPEAYTPVPPVVSARPAAPEEIPAPEEIAPPTPPRVATPPAVAAATNGAAPEAEENTANPFQDPYDFERELQTLLSMGFPDSEELRMALRDFGGEIEAVIDYLFGRS